MIWLYFIKFIHTVHDYEYCTASRAFIYLYSLHALHDLTDNYRYLHPEGSSGIQSADPARFYNRLPNNVQSQHTPPANTSRAEYGHEYAGYQPAGDMHMMHMQALNSISTMLNEIQSQLKLLQEKHQQTDATVTNLQTSLEEIKSSSYKQNSKAKKSPPGLSVSATILLYGYH